MNPVICISEADPDLEAELRLLAEEYAPRNQRERRLVETIVLAERELTKLGRISRATAEPCTSAAFTRTFSSARNARDQANRAFDRLRDRVEATKAARKSKAKPKGEAAEGEDENEDEPTSCPLYDAQGYRYLRDTGLRVEDIVSMMEDDVSDAAILAEFRSLCPEDLVICRAALAKKRAAAGPRPGSSPLLTLLVGVALGLILALGGGRPSARASTPTAPSFVGSAAQPDRVLTQEERSERRTLRGALTRRDSVPLADPRLGRDADARDGAGGPLLVCRHEGLGMRREAEVWPGREKARGAPGPR